MDLSHDFMFSLVTRRKTRKTKQEELEELEELGQQRLFFGDTFERLSIKEQVQQTDVEHPQNQAQNENKNKKSINSNNVDNNRAEQEQENQEPQKAEAIHNLIGHKTPLPIQKLLDEGVLIRWQKYPEHYFVKGLDINDVTDLNAHEKKVCTLQE